MKNQALFSSKDKGKKNKMSSASSSCYIINIFFFFICLTCCCMVYHVGKISKGNVHTSLLLWKQVCSQMN